MENSIPSKPVGADPVQAAQAQETLPVKKESKDTIGAGYIHSSDAGGMNGAQVNWDHMLGKTTVGGKLLELQLSTRVAGVYQGQSAVDSGGVTASLTAVKLTETVGPQLTLWATPWLGASAGVGAQVNEAYGRGSLEKGANTANAYGAGVTVGVEGRLGVVAKLPGLGDHLLVRVDYLDSYAVGGVGVSGMSINGVGYEKTEGIKGSTRYAGLISLQYRL